MKIQIQVQVQIKEQTPYGEFRDAIYFDPKEYLKLKKTDIEALIQERVTNYIYNIENPSPMVINEE